MHIVSVTLYKAFLKDKITNVHVFIEGLIQDILQSKILQHVF